VAITTSAKKAYRASLKKAVYNVRRKREMDNVVSDIKKLVAEKKTKEAMKLVSSAYKAIDKAAKGNTINKGAASRKKARLMAFLNKASK
jgi:ribosomal protein S20